jgi:hypothetical protein
MSPRRIVMLLSLLVLGALALPGVAAAHGRDRNRDGLPDRWERQHHLSLKVKQGQRDQDRDGLKNRGEFRAGTDPRDADTDDDGVDDGNENAGSVKSFTGGVLTITLAAGGELSGIVTPDTEIECEGAEDARASDDGPGGDDDQGDDHSGPGHGDDHGDDDEGDDDEGNCGPEALTAGAKVAEADLHVGNGSPTWEKVELGA